MNGSLKRFLMLVLVLAATAVALLGPGRVYGILHWQQLEGQVVKILPYGKSESAVVELYLVEILVAPNLVYLAPSNDPQWLMVAVGERVRVKLYPSPPWTVGAGPWQNALLVSKLAEVAPPPPVVVAPGAAEAASVESKTAG